MNQQEQIKRRVLDIITICKLSKKDFCELMDIAPCNFGRYFEKNSVSYEDILKYESLGINLRYIFAGKGKKYINNKNGKKIKYLEENSAITESINVVYRLKYWINTHYSSVESFEKLFRINGLNYFDNKSNDFQIPFELKKILCHEGLNIKWLYNKDECPYIYHEIAKSKKNWVLENFNSDNLIYLEMKGVI